MLQARIRFRNNTRGNDWGVSVIILSLSCIFAPMANGQGASLINIHFQFSPTNAADMKILFSKSDQQTVEHEIAESLADSCRNSPWYKHWAYRVDDKNLPRLDVSASGNSKVGWRLSITFAHNPDLTWSFPTTWTDTLLSHEQLLMSGAPVERNWIRAVKKSFARMIDPTESLPRNNGKRILQTLRYFVPLGTDLAMVGPPNFRPGAVLGLKWADNSDLKYCQFRLQYSYSDRNRVVFIHSAAAGEPMDFKPEKPQFPALWVIHSGWQEGGLAVEALDRHLAELSSLDNAPAAFFLEDCRSLIPPDISVALDDSRK